LSDALDYVPVDGRPFRLAMGLRPLDLAHWLEFGGDAAAQLAEKAALLLDRRADVLALTRAGDEACAELLDEIVENLASFHPDERVSGDSGEHPLLAASRLVPEDLCVLAPAAAQWRLVAASVCFPSRWRLGDKIGTSLEAIHGPVPGYADTLASPVTQFFDRLVPERGFWRLNWTLLDDPALFQPTAGRPATAVDPGDLVFRVERQTLRRLPTTGAVVFTIRTYRRRAAELAAAHAQFASDVLVALATAPADSLAYKGWAGLAPRWAARFGLAL
jgi:dimethylamine monooxygenase subunit A